MSRESLGFLIGLVAIAIFGASLPSTRLSVVALDPWFVTALRTLSGGAVALAALAIWRPPFPRAHLGRLAAIALCVVIGFPAVMTVAMVSVPAAHGGVVLGLLPLATTVGAVIFAGERPSAYFWLLTVVGAALVTAYALRDTEVAIVVGDFLLIVAVLVAGMGYALAAALSRTVPGWQVIAWAIVIGLPLAIPATLAWWPADAAAVPASAWGAVAFSGIVVLFLGYALWNVALAWGGVARVGQIQLLQPFVTFLIAMPLLGESVDLPMVAFAVAVGIVVALGRRASVRPAAAATN